MPHSYSLAIVLENGNARGSKLLTTSMKRTVDRLVAHNYEAAIDVVIRACVARVLQEAEISADHVSVETLALIHNRS